MKGEMVSMKTIVTRIPCRFPLEPKIKFYYKKKKRLNRLMPACWSMTFSFTQTNLYLISYVLRCILYIFISSIFEPQACLLREYDTKMVDAKKQQPKKLWIIFNSYCMILIHFPTPATLRQRIALRSTSNRVNTRGLSRADLCLTN